MTATALERQSPTVKNLYDPANAADLRDRLARFRPDTPRAWGTMSQSQMLAHCAVVMEMAVGDTRPSRMFIGRLIGSMVMRKVTRDDAPLRRNTPTAPQMVITTEPELEAERTRLRTLIDRFEHAGPNGCTTHPHTFFGAMTPQQWSVLMYKHIDHHLRQFNA